MAQAFCALDPSFSHARAPCVFIAGIRSRHVHRRALLTAQEIHAYGEEPDVRAAQSAPFGVQQCISALVHRDPHDVARIVALPELDGTPAFGQNEWVLEQLKYVRVK